VRRRSGGNPSGTTRRRGHQPDVGDGEMSAPLYDADIVPTPHQLTFLGLLAKAVRHNFEAVLETFYVFVALDHIPVEKRSPNPEIALFIADPLS